MDTAQDWIDQNETCSLRLATLMLEHHGVTIKDFANECPASIVNDRVNRADLVGFLGY